MVLTGMKLRFPTLIKRYGREAVRKMYAASLDAIDCVEQIVREESIDCNFSRCGHLEVACKRGHFDGYEESAALVKREFNHELRIIPKNGLRGEIGSDIYFGGMVDETSAGLNPARYVAGLAHAAQRAGACLYDHTRVTSVELEKNNNARKFRVYTSKGAITAREVILASGAYTTDATPALRKKNHSHRLVHHRHGSSAQRSRPRTQPAQPHDLRLETFSLLLPAHAGQSHALRRPALPFFPKPKTPCARAPKFSAAA